MYKQVRNTEIDYEHDTTYYDHQIFQVKLLRDALKIVLK